MGCIQFDLRGALSFLSERELVQMEQAAETAKDELVEHTGAGNDFHGWVDLPEAYDREEFARIQKAAAKIQGDSDVLVVAGIGGSYLGARAAIEFLRHGFYNQLPKGERKTPEIYFVGNNMSGQYMNALIDVIGRARLLAECHFEVRHDDGDCHQLPCLQEPAREEVRQGGRGVPHLCDDGQAARCVKAARRPRGL